MNAKTTTRTVAMSLALASILLGTTAQGAITFLKNWGTSGSGDGQFQYPCGVAVNNAGEVYVVDTINSRIQKFTANGVYQLQFGTSGSGNGQFSYPNAIAVNSTGEVYVADTSNSRIQKFTATGTYQLQFGSLGGGNVQFLHPDGVAVNNAGEVYVADTSNSRIQKFTDTGVYQSQIGGSGSGNGQFSFPRAVAVNSAGEVYVADTSNSRIQKFTAYGTYLSQFGTYGSGNGQFDDPYGVAVNSTGEVYVVDRFNNRISKWFDLDAWTSGTPHLDTAAVGPGALLGSWLYLDVTKGLQVDGLLTVQPGGSLTQQGANITTGQFQNNGAFALSGRTLTITAGLLTNNTSMTMSGGTVAGNVSNAYGALCTAQGAVTGSMANYGTLTLTGLLSVGPMTNAGTINISSGQQLVATSLTNSGTIRGEGAIAAPLTNQGLVNASGVNALALTQFSTNQPSGELRVENGSTLQILGMQGGQAPYVANLGLIALKGSNAALSGDTIINQGTIQGQGRVSNTVSNQATIRAEGGQLNFFGSDNNNSGTIECPAGGTVAYSQGLMSNQGLIALDGGAFNHTGATLTNYGPIRGHGTLRTAALNNFNIIAFSEGSNSIFGNVTNKAGAQIYNYGNSSSLTTFFSAVTNEAGAHIGVKGGTIRFLGPFLNSGIYDTDPADNYFSDLSVTSTGVVTGGAGDRFFINGNFTNAGQLNLGGGSTTTVKNGTGDLVQTGGSLAVGAGASLAAGTVHIQGGTISAGGGTAVLNASLDYTSPASSTFEGILAGDGTSVELNNPAAVLRLLGTLSYTGDTRVLAGVLEIHSLSNSGSTTVGNSKTTANLFADHVRQSSLTINDRGKVTITGGGGASGTSVIGSLSIALPGNSVGQLEKTVEPVPEPGTLALLAIAGALGLLAWRRK